ncbi:HAD family hydrolase [bacterium M21]|nr:HAD family hydrolase [bacterium M21]
MQKKYILFDHDGVLVDTERWYFEASQKALAEIGVTMTLEQYLPLMVQGRKCWELATDASAAVIAEQRDRRNGYYQEYLRTKEIEISGVEEVLEELAGNYRMAIITTSRREDFELIHKGRNLVSYMDFVLCLEDYPRSKPAPDPYLAGVHRFGAPPAEVIAVEDSQRGLQSTIAAGIDCVIVDHPFTRTHDFSGARCSISSLAELPALLG